MWGKAMGRAPVIQRAVLKVLEKAGKPLRFSEIHQRAEEELGRKINSKNLAVALTKLCAAGLVEKTLINGKVSYRLTNLYSQTAIKSMTVELINKVKPENVLPCFEHEDFPVFLFFIDGEIPDERICDVADNPSAIIANTILDNILKPNKLSNITLDNILKLNMRELEGIAGITSELREAIRKLEGIIELTLWAYWAGIQAYRNDFISLIEREIKYSQKIIEKCRTGEKRCEDERVAAEENIIQILNLTKKLLLARNLKEFMDHAEKNYFIYKQKLNEVLRIIGKYPHAGEKMFEELVENKADILDAGLPTGLPYCNPQFRYLGRGVWNIVIQNLLKLGEDKWGEISGDEKKAREEVEARMKYFATLRDVVCKTKVVVTYVWGIPLHGADLKHEFLPRFEEWLNLLKNGYLAYRKNLLDVSKLNLLRIASKRVKRGQPPPNRRLDEYESWTLAHIYYLHPRGKDPEFWEEFIKIYENFLKQHNVIN